MLNDSKIAAYTAILQEELLLATGCTEPIAVAYCAAKLREVLGGKPEKIKERVHRRSRPPVFGERVVSRFAPPLHQFFNCAK